MEQLDEENSWYCNQCKDHVRAFKKIEIYKVPPVLILCLQRFKSHNIYFKDKLEDQVDFPLQGLDLRPYVLSHADAKGQPVDLSYDLIAVSNHYGSLSGGHYTACALNQETGHWYDFNDSHVSQLSGPDAAVSSAAYVLYYVRRDLVPGTPINYEAIKI